MVVFTFLLSLTEKHVSVLPAVFSAIGEGQTRGVVNTRRFIVHTLQSCKKTRHGQSERLLIWYRCH